MTLGTQERISRQQESILVKMNSVPLNKSESGCELLLGVTIQCNLKWSEHISNLVKKLKSRLTGLERLRLIMKKSNRKVVVQGIFESVLSYCLPLFGGCNSTDLNLLQNLQNRAARIAMNVPSRFSRSVMYNDLQWLTVRQLVVYHTLLVVFRIRLTRAPAYLASQLLNENRRGNIVIKNYRLELYRKSFVPRGGMLWNQLPHEVREAENLQCFKKSLKTWIKVNVSMFED